MSAANVLRALAKVGAAVRVDDGKLIVDAPKGAITSELAKEIRENKAELLEALSEIGVDTGDRVTASPEHRGSVSATQERIYAIDRLAPETAAYNLAGIWSLEGPLDQEAMTRAVKDLLERHAMLRARFVDRGNGLELSTEMPAKAPVEFRDCRGMEQAEILAWVEKTAAVPYDLEVEGPLRLFVLEYAEDRAFFFVASHGIVWDAWSYDVLLRDLGELYSARVEGRAPELEALDVGYEDFAAWQKRQHASEAMEQKIQAALERLEPSMDRVPLPSDFPVGQARSHAGARFNYSLTRELCDAIREESRQSGITPFMILLAGFATLVARQSQVERLVVTIPVRNRNERALEGLIGPFTNNLFVPIDLTGSPGFGEMVARVRAAMMEGMSNQDVPFDRILAALGPRAQKTSLFQLDFSYQDTSERVRDWGTLRILPGPPFGFHTTHAVIGWWVLSQPNGVFGGAVDYRTELFREQTVRRFVEQYQRLLALGLEDKTTPIWQLPIDDAQLTDAETGVEAELDTDTTKGLENARASALIDTPPTASAVRAAHWLIDRACAPNGKRVFLATRAARLRRAATLGTVMTGRELESPDLMRGDVPSLAETIESAEVDLVVADVPTALALQSVYQRPAPLTLLDAGAVTAEDLETLGAALAVSFDRNDEAVALWRLGAGLVGVRPGVEVRVADRWGSNALVASVGALAVSSAVLEPKQRVRVPPEGSPVFLGATPSRDRGVGLIESVLESHPAVVEALVALPLHTGRLVGYVVCKTGEYVLPSELRAYLRERLPVASVPGVIREVDALPRTSEGLVDHSALPDPFNLVLAREHVPPQTKLEQDIAAVWSELLEVDSVGLYDNFFDLGGNSLLAVRAVARISTESGLRVEPRALFFDSLSQLASSIETR